MDTLRRAGVVPDVAERLAAESGASDQALIDSVIQEVPAYTASGNPDVLPELRRQIMAHTEAVVSLLAGRTAGEFDFVRSHAQRRAEQKFPLEALIQTYRCAHKVLLPWIRDASLAVANKEAQVPRVVAAVTDLLAVYVDAVGRLAISEYVAHTRRFAEAEGDRRTELLNILLHGYDESDARAAELLRRGGYLEQRQSFCVVVARSVNPREMLNAARAQRMLDALDSALQDAPVRTLLGVRDELVTAVVSGVRRQSGWTAPQSLLAERLQKPLRKLGPAALIGVSMDAPSTSHIPRALKEAQLALDVATVADRVVPYGRIPFRDMLVQVAADQVQGTLPVWLEPFAAADERAKGIYVDTLRAYADNDMNVLRTAEMLSIHPNTIYARMQKIEGITGHNPLKFNALNELLLATDCRRSV
ncbi:MAG: helix-turn-helix domain-containing protein [Woeseiaceae bacterium]|nr:helix-turn-helix domain-containing protein [Woeseiaceae bacterium]